MIKHICFINRWSTGWNADKPGYEKIVDHMKYKISYIVNKDSYNGLEQKIRDKSKIIIIDDINNIDHLQSALEEIIESIGKVDKLIALSEWDIINAAKLREIFDIKGMQLEQAMSVRDKVVMKNKLLVNKNIRLPFFSEIQNTENVFEFVELYGLPIVLKPRKLAASQGVEIIHSMNDLNDILAKKIFIDYECEQYINKPVYHIDGLVMDGKLIYVVPFEYQNAPVEFFRGKPLSSLSVIDNEAKVKLLNFTKEVIETLQINNTSFHLEAFFDVKTDESPIFLEIGARVGGGDIPRMVELLLGYDSFYLHMKCELEEEMPHFEPINKQTGFLMIPFPDKLPCRVVANQSLKNIIPSIVDEHLRKIGEILDGSGGYLKVPSRFVFFGEDLQEDLKKALSRYSVEFENV